MRIILWWTGAFLLLAACSSSEATPTPTTRAALPTVPAGDSTITAPTAAPTVAPVISLEPLALVTASGPLPPACPLAPRTRLIVTERGRVLDDDTRLLNVRAGPGTGADIVNRLEVGDVFIVLEGPRCAEIYAWFRVQAGDITGWIAEGETGLYYVGPYPPG